MKPIVAVPATLALVYRAWSRNSLTPLGILVASLTAVIHVLHPWSAPFALLAVFFLTGTAATKVKHDIKSTLTLSSAGSPSGEGPRTHVQVLANTLCASVLILIHIFKLYRSSSTCLSYGNDIFIVGIVSNYAAVAADTFSSELGILSTSKPRLITTLRTVPPGTNGGVTLAGIAAGALGSFIVAVTSAVLLPFCTKTSGPVGRVLMAGEYRGWGLDDKILWVLAITIWGLLGSVLDSFLGAVLQASVVDKRTGKIVEGTGGIKVLTRTLTSYGVKVDGRSSEAQRNSALRKREGKVVSGGNSESGHEESRRVLSGADLLDNNQINLLMAATMSFGGMVIASLIWDMPLSSVVS